MKNRGYALSAIVYPLLLVCLSLILSILFNLNAKKSLLDFLKQSAQNSEEIKYHVYSNGTAIYFNPVTGKTCSSGNSVSLTGTKTGCMKWYAFNDRDSSSTVNLLLDHNTTATSKWTTDDTTTKGPSASFLNQLKSDTSSWTGVVARTDSYSFDNGTIQFSIDYTGYRARLLTGQEVAMISNYSGYNEATSNVWYYFGSNSTTDTSLRANYGWLYDRTSTTCSTYGCSNNSDTNTWGFWLATPLTGYTNLVLVVSPYGRLDNFYPNQSNNSWGIRPVITISKDILS